MKFEKPILIKGMNHDSFEKQIRRQIGDLPPVCPCGRGEDAVKKNPLQNVEEKWQFVCGTCHAEIAADLRKMAQEWHYDGHHPFGMGA
jgi:hypothetical protein